MPKKGKRLPSDPIQWAAKVGSAATGAPPHKGVYRALQKRRKAAKKAGSPKISLPRIRLLLKAGHTPKEIEKRLKLAPGTLSRGIPAETRAKWREAEERRKAGLVHSRP